MVILSIVIAERPVQNISRAQGINHLYGIDRDLTCVLRRTIDDGPLTTGNRLIAHALTSQIRQNSIFLTSTCSINSITTSTRTIATITTSTIGTTYLLTTSATGSSISACTARSTVL